MQQNLAALAVVVVLLVLGAWMIDRLMAYSRTLACIEFGHRSCMKLDVNRPANPIRPPGSRRCSGGCPGSRQTLCWAARCRIARVARPG